MKCYYHNDLDGRCSCFIVYKYESEQGNICEVIPVDYNDEIDVSKIENDEKIYIVDFSFKPELMGKVLQKTTNVIWIDHHKTAKDYKYPINVKGIREFEDNKFAACELTWMYLYPDTKIPFVIQLIGDKDCWRWKFGRKTDFFNEGIKLYDTYPLSAIWYDILKEEAVNDIIAKGSICVKYRDKFCSEYLEMYSFETYFEGYKCLVCNVLLFGSLLFGKKISEYDICISLGFLGDKWKLSLYSEKIDVSKIAKKYGGGGHKGAAGFYCDELPFNRR